MHSQPTIESRTLQALWGGPPPAGRGPRPRFDLDEVASAAVMLADAGGLAAVSLAKLASQLALTTTALYRYVSSKDALVRLMVDAAIGSPPPLIGDEWRSRAGSWARQLWHRYMDHPWLCEVTPGGMALYPNRLAWMDVLLGELDSGPIDEPMHTALLLDGLGRTFALLARSVEDEPAPPPAWLVETVAGRYPRFARELNRDWTDIENGFETAVAIVLAGAAQIDGSRGQKVWVE